jgi:uncharacterized protein
MSVGIFAILSIIAFGCEFIDCSLGMGYGTILTPVLLSMGFDPLVCIPAVLLSQAFGGLSASIFHHQFENVSFNKDSDDLKSVLIIGGFGVVATIIGAVVSLGIPKVVLKTYIGILVLLMGVIILRNRLFKFSWKKMVGVGLLSAFNKGISGGGYGPVVTGGQILSGYDHRAAIGVTTLAEAPICICGFLTYLIGRTIKECPSPVLKMPVAEFFQIMFSPKMLNWELLLALILGSILVTPFGAFTTRILKKSKLHYVVGVLITVLGCYTLAETWW